MQEVCFGKVYVRAWVRERVEKILEYGMDLPVIDNLAREKIRPPEEIKWMGRPTNRVKQASVNHKRNRSANESEYVKRAKSALDPRQDNTTRTGPKSKKVVNNSHQ